MNPDQDDVLRRIAAGNPVPVLDNEAVNGQAAIDLRERVLRAESSASAHSAVRRRRKAIIGGGVAGILVAGGLAAAATGLVPDGVARRLGEVAPSGSSVAGATMLVEHVSPNGIRDQVWVGHLRHSGKQCQDAEYVRSVAPKGAQLPDHAREDGMVGCGLGEPGSPADKHKAISVGEVGAGRPWPSLTYEVIVRTDVATRARVGRMDAVYSGGRSYDVSYNNRTGWGIGVVPPEVTNLDGVLVVRDAAGAILAREPLPRTGEAPADPCGYGEYRRKNCGRNRPASLPATNNPSGH